MGIKKEDVELVAKSLNFKPTDEQIKDIISLYPSAQENDPTGTWDLVVENLLYELEVEQTKTVK